MILAFFPGNPVSAPLRRCAVPVLAALFVAGSGPLQAQAPSLDRVDSLMAQGDVPAARQVLSSWWDARFDDAPSLERQKALWLRGKLTVDAGMARRDYLRLVLEHPGGPHSADALLRLAQAEHAAGRILEASRYHERLLRDYPDSPHRLEARRWLDENREAVSRARTDSPSSSPGPSDAPTPAATESLPVTIQLGAFSSEERARELMGRAEDEGIEGVRMVRVAGSRLLRVRAGRFPNRSAAAGVRARIRNLGFDAAVVTDADEERMVP